MPTRSGASAGRTTSRAWPYLASDEAAWITGASYVIDGGFPRSNGQACRHAQQSFQAQAGRLTGTIMGYAGCTIAGCTIHGNVATEHRAVGRRRET